MKRVKKEPKVERLIFPSYLAAIENSVGTKMFKNFYAKVGGKKVDVMKDGWLSCALYVSSILALFKLAEGVHATVDSTVKDLEKSGWKKIARPKKGSVIVWEKIGKDADGVVRNHKHIGFYIGNKQAVSNDSWKKFPIRHPWDFAGKRKVEAIFWNPKLK